MIYTAFVNTILFFLLAALHVYWLLGGRWGLAVAVPTQANSKIVFEPGLIFKLATFVVIVGLSIMGLLHYWAWTGVPSYISGTYLSWGLSLISGIFFLRVLGDFNYVGLFKRIKDSDFAWYDNRLYMPLCLLLAINAGVCAYYY